MTWTEENNKATINQLLDYYADLLSRYADFVEQLGTADLPTKLKSLQTLKSVAFTIDALLRRWSFANRGYDSNTHQARQAAAELSNRKSTPEKDTEAVSYRTYAKSIFIEGVFSCFRRYSENIPYLT